MYNILLRLGLQLSFIILIQAETPSISCFLSAQSISSEGDGLACYSLGSYCSGNTSRITEQEASWSCAIFIIGELILSDIHITTTISYGLSQILKDKWLKGYINVTKIHEESVFDKSVRSIFDVKSHFIC